MSSLRLALKQSLEDTTKIDTNHHHRRRLKKLKKKKKLLAAAQAAAAAGNASGEGVAVVNTEGAAGTTNLQEGGNDVGAAIHYLKPAPTTSGIRDPLKDGSASSSTLSSSDDDDDDDDSSSSSSSSSSDSSSSSSDDDDSDDDDDDDSSSSSSDSDSSSSSSDSSSSSEDNDTVDREAKQLFDADLSSSESDEHHHVVTTHHDGSNPMMMMMMDEDENSSTEKRRRKRLKKQSKTKLKARRKQQRERRDQNDAAVLIQSHWKKKAQAGGGDDVDVDGGGNVEEGRGYRPDTTHEGGEMKQPPLPPTATATAGEEQPTNNPPSTTATTTATATSKKTSKTVEPPHPQILHHITLMSEKRQRRSIHTNLRVKVRFVKKANIQGKLTRKLKWYGGVIVGIGNKGRKVKIEYDDGTSEVADFPDKDIIVDDVNNGVHGSAVVGEGEKVVNKGSAFRPRSGGVMVGEDSKKEGGGGGGEKKQGGMMNVDDIIVGAQVPATTVKELSLSAPPEEMSQDKFVEPTPRLVSNEIVVEGGAAAVDEAASSIVKELSTNENETNSSTPQQQRNAPLANTAVAADEKEEASSEEEGEILEETTAPTPAISTFAPTPAAVEETNNTAVPGNFMAQGQLNPIVTKDADVPMMSTSLPQKEAESVPPSHGSDEKKKIDDSITIGATTTTTSAAVPSPSKKMAPEKEKEDNASSSSGSTCSSVSFAGPSSAADAAAAVADPAVAAVKTNAENMPVEMPSHVDVNNGEDANGEATLFDDDEDVKEPESSNGNDDDDEEEEEGEIDEGDEAASSPPKDEPPVPKKRGPLRIRIGLSAAVKRKIEEEMDAMNEATPRSKKKAKLSSDNSDGDANMEDAPADVTMPSTETTEKLKEPQGSMTEELAPKKRKSVDSEDASDGENQEGSGSKKASGVDGAAPPQRKKPGRKKKMTEIEKLKQDSIIEKTKQDSTLQDKDVSMNEAVDVDSGKSPRSFNSDTPEDDNAFSMARVGRKAAQRAAEKIAEKKTKKRNKDSTKESTEENTTTTAAPAVKAKKEEDPWVQCDRCHKWRHLPATVNLDDLPEHWFCELNTHDPKRNNCEAAEQTPKEVAKEKKRAKKLAWKKLQMEQAQALAKEGSKKRARSASPPPRGIDKEAEFDAVVATSIDKKSDDHVVNEATAAPPTTEPLPPKPKRRGRPPRSDKEKEKTPPNAPNAAPGGKGKDAPKQEWVQCEKCEKWRRLPPRISAEELPDVWYCSMNTWDINLATCTAIEDKHEENSKEYNVQSQIPTFAGSSSKTSYRNLIFGNGRQKRNISERMRAQESLFARDEEVDMSAPPTAMYAKSSAFFNKSLAKASAQETNKVLQPSIFDYMACSRVWAELNHMRRPNSKQHLYGYDKFCQPDGSLNKDSIDTLKAMSYFALGANVLSGNEVLLQVQLQQWGYEVPTSWLELRSLSTIEIVNFILDELIKDGLVECIVLDKLSLDNVLYRQRTISSEEAPQQQGIQAPAGCLKISKPWK
ncbi:hypothetical protein QTG54_006793 [Skeletonema marinoi]|uniref:CW-type domain-containing protein n=1 Tax=Skeletonema marinoi TaxID=267567 RepID=A0AAD9DDZ9_9STRA|nr:hypothetical protein QTG54_006793 [Skeletonema marinoi]